jgi:hypothetical protein
MGEGSSLRKKGIIEHGKRDNFVQIRNSKVPPTIISDISKIKEGVSWSIPLKRSQAYTEAAGMTVAEIFFATNIHDLTFDDIIAIDSLIADIKFRLTEGFKIKLLCTGGADYRASDQHNLDLGQKRADSVKKYIETRITDKKFKIHSKTIGESQAQQPKNGKSPSQLEMMKDRKVVVTIDNNGLLPPVTLAVTGNWILGINIERNEINNGGSIVALPGSFEAEDGKKEYELWKTGMTKANKGKEQDPLLPVVVIKTNYYIQKVNNIDEAFVECKVIHQMTHRTLFTASAQTDARNKITEIYSYDPEYSSVMRKVNAGDVVEAGRKTKERVLKDSEVNMRGLYLFDAIYTQLKGSYKTITERVEAILAKT